MREWPCSLFVVLYTYECDCAPAPRMGVHTCLGKHVCGPRAWAYCVIPWDAEGYKDTLWRRDQPVHACASCLHFHVGFIHIAMLSHYMWLLHHIRRWQIPANKLKTQLTRLSSLANDGLICVSDPLALVRLWRTFRPNDCSQIAQQLIVTRLQRNQCAALDGSFHNVR